MTLTCREFKRAVGRIKRRTVAEWEKACSEMPLRERQVALGFVWFQGLYVDSPTEARRLSELSHASGCICPLSPSGYAEALHKAGFPSAACKVVEAVQESLARQQEKANRSKVGGRGR